MLNQFNAQQNLLFGGAGYGGSFESADQRKARAAGGSLNSKAYGGWGGYGSTNPIMTNQPNYGTPDTAYTPWSPNQPDTWGGGGNTPIPGGGGGQSSPWGQPFPTTPAYNPQSQPWTGEPEVYTQTIPKKAQVPGGTGYTQSANVAKPATMADVNPYTAEGLAKLQDPTFRAQALADHRAQSAKNGNSDSDQIPWYLDGDLVKMQADLVAAGMNPNSQGSYMRSAQQAKASGVPMDQISNHFKSVVGKLGPEAFNMSHGAYGKVKASDIAGGTALSKVMANAGPTPSADTLAAGTATPPSTPPKTAPAPGGTKAQLPGFAQNSVATVPEAASMTASVPQGSGAASTQTDPVASFFEALQGGLGQVTQSPAFKEWASQQSWNGWKPQNTIDINSDGTVNTNPKSNQATGSGYEQFAKAAVVPPGSGGSIVGGGAGGGTGPGGTGGTGGTGGGPAPIGTGDLGDNGNTSTGGGGYDPNSPYGPNGGIEYPAWGRNWVWQEPKVGPDGKIVKGADGKPVMETKSRSQWEFQQGQNDGMTGDEWSTSAPWRPEEPTGGIYGAYTGLASGNLTDYENQIGSSWRDYADNPAQAEDVGYANALAQYNKTPGKGIDEAYGAYNKMLQGNGYSDAEKGAIEGSAVRGASTGYQRSADEMRRQAARTGDPSAAYGALSTVGASYGRDLGEMNRQNQVKFADEAQRRQETGASGMTNVASLANTKAQFGLNSQQQYANELARRREAGTRGMGDYASFGRGLQQQGISGLSDLYKQNTNNTQNMYGALASLLNQNYGSAATNNSKGFGWNGGISV
jgi:hypothetical protein